MRLGWGILAWVWSLCGYAQSITLANETQQQQWAWQTLNQQLTTEHLALFEPVQQQPMAVQAWPLLDVLRLAGLADALDGARFRLVAADGYAPVLSGEQLQQAKAYLAFASEGAAPHQFPRLAVGKQWLNPAPYYLLWQSKDASLPRPYQLVRIERLASSPQFTKMQPAIQDVDSAVAMGFRLFQQHCQACHSINLQGGEVGPELNIPQNITEYRSEAFLKAFIRDSNAFRARSRMPAFSQLTETELQQLLAYLRHMAGRKQLPRRLK